MSSEKRFVVELINGLTYCKGPHPYKTYKRGELVAVDEKEANTLNRVADEIPVKLGNQPGRKVRQKKFNIVQFDSQQEAMEYIDSKKPVEDEFHLNPDEEEILATISATRTGRRDDAPIPRRQHTATKKGRTPVEA